MTKEELNKEATEYALKWGDKTDGTYACCRDGYLAGAEPREKRIAELDCQKNRNKSCYSCINATERCFRNEIGCPCQKYKFWKEENTELKLKLEALDPTLEDCTESLTDARIKIKELKKELEQAKKVQVVEHFEAYGQCRDSRRIVSLEKENAELKCFIKDLIYENQNLCFQFSNTTCLFNSDYRNRAEELIGEKL